MGLEELSLRLEREHESQIQKLKAEYGQKIADIDASIAADCEKIRLQILSSAERMARIKKLKIISGESNRRMSELSLMKANAIDEVLSLACKKIEGLAPDRQAAFLKKLLGEGNAIEEPRKIYIDPKYIHLAGDARAVEKDIGELGAVIESEDGLMRIDSRLSSVFALKSHSLRAKVNEVLSG
jgi:vacuolar-type H+-ATPase subunit E/Vma4